MKICAKAGQQLLDVTVERRDGIYVVEIDGTRHEVDVYKLEGDFFSFLVGDKSYEVSVASTREGYRVRHGAAEQLVTLTDPGRQARDAMVDTKGPTTVHSVMPGKVVRILVNEGDEVEAGQGIVVVEAMKMENEIAAPKAGTIRSIAVAPDQAVEGGAELLVIE